LTIAFEFVHKNARKITFFRFTQSWIAHNFCDGIIYISLLVRVSRL
jgi:hypothetical protein